MTEHRTEVVSNFFSPGWWAACSCGWVGVLQDDVEAATLDADSHRAFEASTQQEDAA
jgi:hypothetical protein